MKNKFVSLLAIILGIIIIAFPMIGVIGTSSLIGLSVLLISIYLLVAGVAIIDYNKSGAIIDLILGIILLFLSLGLIFNPNCISCRNFTLSCRNCTDYCWSCCFS